MGLPVVCDNLSLFVDYEVWVIPFSTILNLLLEATQWKIHLVLLGHILIFVDYRPCFQILRKWLLVWDAHVGKTLRKTHKSGTILYTFLDELTTFHEIGLSVIRGAYLDNANDALL